MNPDEKCGQCRFFVPTKVEEKVGECRRHAPRPSPSFQIGGKEVGQQPRWPEVGVNTCCGEFKQK